MADVGQELSLVGERRLQAVEHRVEGAAELSDLVVAAHRDALREVGLGDLARRPCQGLQRLPSRGPQRAR